MGVGRAAGGWGFAPAGGAFRPVTLPHSWLGDFPEAASGVYRRRIARCADRPLWLRFGAAADEAEVRLDGRVLGRHVGPWTPFVVELPPAEAGGESELEVRVRRRPDHPTRGFLPDVGVRWAGLWQPVDLLDAPPAAAPPVAPRLRADGRRFVLDGRPWTPRGVLHWGRYPELGHPGVSPEQADAEVRCIRAFGFDLVKACLWLPPRGFMEACERHGLLVWQEYPLWRTRLDGSDAESVLAEVEEMVRRDRDLGCVVLRTLTCENDHVPDAVGERFVRLCHELAPGGLALTNSGWFANDGPGDFWDEHLYLDASRWPAALERTAEVWHERPARPLVLGETMAVDAPPASARARRAALAVRREQVELLSVGLPGAGFVVTAWRDLPTAPLGVADEAGNPKWTPDDFAFLAEPRLVAFLPRRSFHPGEELEVPLALVAGGEVSCHGSARLRAPATVGDAPRRFAFAARLDGVEAEWPCVAVPEVAPPDGVGLAPALDWALGHWLTRPHPGWSPLVRVTTEDDEPLEPLLGEAAALELLAGRVLAADLRLHGADEVALPEAAVPLAVLVDPHDRAEPAALPLVVGARHEDGELRLHTALRTDTPAGRFLHAALARRLRDQPPRSTLRDADFPTAVPQGPDATLPEGRALLLDRWERCDAHGRWGAGRLGAFPSHEGWVWFRTRFTLPPGPHELVFAGVGDAFRALLDRRPYAWAGNPTGTWHGCRDRVQRLPVPEHLATGPHTLHLEVRDWRAAPALQGPVLLVPTPGIAHGRPRDS